MENKQLPTITDLVAETFGDMPKVFYASDLINDVRKKIALLNIKRFPFDSTILRELRRLRDRGECNWYCSDNKKAIYCKN